MEPFSALLLSNDRVSLAVSRKVLDEYGITAKVAETAAAASQLIKTGRFDLGVYDSELPGALRLAEPDGSGRQPKMLFVLVRPGSFDQVRGKHIHFVMQKPFTADLFARSLRAAYGTMLRERRTAFRHTVAIKPSSCVLVTSEEDRALKDTTILDLSQTGLCLQTNEALPPGATLEIRFALPGTSDQVHVSGNIMWSRASGRTGVRFMLVSATNQKTLHDWLESRLPSEADFVSRAPAQVRSATASVLSI